MTSAASKATSESDVVASTKTVSWSLSSLSLMMLLSGQLLTAPLKFSVNVKFCCSYFFASKSSSTISSTMWPTFLVGMLFNGFFCFLSVLRLEIDTCSNNFLPDMDLMKVSGSVLFV